MEYLARRGSFQPGPSFGASDLRVGLQKSGSLSGSCPGPRPGINDLRARRVCCAPDRRATDLEDARRLANRLAHCDHLACMGGLLWRELRRAATLPCAIGTCRQDARVHTFTNQVPLELCQRSEDVQHEP